MNFFEKIDEIIGLIEQKTKRAYIVVYNEPDAKKLANVLGSRYMKSSGPIGRSTPGVRPDDYMVTIPPRKQEQARFHAKDVAGRGAWKFYKVK